MEQDLIKFYDNITKGKKYFIYEDEKGNYSEVTDKRYLIVSISYLELDEPQYKKAIFDKTIDKTLKYSKTKVTRPVDKSTITHKDKDKGTLIDSDVEVYQVWVAANPCGAKHSFINKEEALKFAKDTNKRFYDTID